MADFEMRRNRTEHGLEFERNGFNDHRNYSEGSFKPKKDTQVIRVQRMAVLLLHTNHDISSIRSWAGNHSRYDNCANHYREITV